MLGILSINLLPELPGFYQITSLPAFRVGLILLATGTVTATLCLSWRNHHPLD
jgi:hypothetical protein